MRRSRQTGYTLIELLLYISIVGALLTAVVFFFGTVVDSRLKNESISEVNDQAAAVMDTITQTLHNATSVTVPATAATSSPSLTLVVPTGALSPTIFDMSGTTLGYNLDGTGTDSSDSGSINATKFVASATGTISSLNAYVASVGTSPNNKAQMAIYSGTSSPSTLLASSASVTLNANTWTNFPISRVSVTSGQTYWLAYNASGAVSTVNNLRSHTGTSGQSQYITQTYGTWPNSWTGTAQAAEFSMYAMIDAANTPGTVRSKEGSGTATALTDSNVQLSGLNFRNLTRSGTSPTVQVTFTLSRLNPNNRNEFEYSKTFVGTATVGW